MLKKGPGNVARQFPRERACDECNLYSTHMSHRGLVYEFFYDAGGGYHRHIVCCADLGLRVQTERVQ